MADEENAVAEIPCMEIDLYDGRKLKIRKSGNYSGILSISDPSGKKGQEDYFFLKTDTGKLIYDGRGCEVKEQV